MEKYLKEPLDSGEIQANISEKVSGKFSIYQWRILEKFSSLWKNLLKLHFFFEGIRIETPGKAYKRISEEISEETQEPVSR